MRKIFKVTPVELAGNIKMSTEENFEKLSETQRLKAAVHHTTLKICLENAENENTRPNSMVVASISETVWRKFESWATDLEQFAKHGKRNTINADDVKMLIRKSPKLLAHINQVHEQLSAAKGDGKKKSKKSKSKDSTTVSVSSVTEMDENSRS